MKPLLTFLFALCTIGLYSQDNEIPPEMTEVWEPEPRAVQPGNASTPPSDAVVLFDGSNADAFLHEDGSAVKWTLADGAMTVVGGTGDIVTKESFGSIQLHIEFQTPAKVESEGQGRGNSGVFLQSKYEVQVLDNYKNRTYSNGQAGSIYKQSIPLVNACRPPGEWQAYDIIFNAPVFNKDGVKVRSAYLTVIHNGVLIQNHTQVLGTTEYIGMPKNEAHGPGPIKLQDHGNPVKYRNIWLRKLD